MLLLLGCFSACTFFYLAYKLIYDEWEKGIGIIFIICGIIVIIGSGKIQNDFHQFNVKITEDREKLKTKIAKEKEKRKTQEKKLRQLAASGDADIVIDGKPAGDNFDLDGIRLKDYEIKFKNGKVYLISY